MRLSQLARQLETDADKIVKHLAKEGVEVENSPNTKLTDDQIAIANKKFFVKKEVVTETKEPTIIKSAAEKLADLDAVKADADEEPAKAESKKEVKTEKVEAPKKTVKKAAPKKIELDEEPKVIKAELDKDPTIDDSAEVIKAPKVELEGIKVIGKIDLPEKPVKEAPVAAEEPEKEEESQPIVEEVVNDGPKVHPSKLAKQKAKEVLEIKPTYLPPTPDEQPKKVKTHTHNSEPSEKRSRKRVDKDYEPLWQKKQTYYTSSDSKNIPAQSAAPSANGEKAPKPRKKTWIGRFFQWWTTE